MPLQGFLDTCTSGSVAGWAWNPEAPDRQVSVDIFDGTRLLKRLEADLFRGDLKLAGKGDGACAFSYVLPPAILDDQLHWISVRFADTGEELAQSPQSVVWNAGERHELEQLLRACLKSPPWRILSAQYTPNRLEIAGFALPPSDGRATTFRLNGRSFDEIQTGLSSADYGSMYWYWPNSDGCGFVCSTTVTQEELFTNGSAMLEYADLLTGEPLYRFHNFYWPPNLFTAGNLPGEEGMTRVTGNAMRHTFLQNGFTMFVKLKLVLEAIVGRWPSGETLDWGCGCGRITRWLIGGQLPDVRLCGADIDPVNIQWCNEHLPGATFTQIPLHPRTPYRDGQFSVILGMSVFTHLQEAVQFEWLEELQRIAAPGAILLMSVHGDASASRAAPNESWLRAWRSRGFDAAQLDPALAEVIEDKEYYRAAFHTIEYVQQHWSKYFEILDIVDFVVSNGQNLVVLRRR